MKQVICSFTMTRDLHVTLPPYGGLKPWLVNHVMCMGTFRLRADDRGYTTISLGLAGDQLSLCNPSQVILYPQ